MFPTDSFGKTAKARMTEYAQSFFEPDAGRTSEPPINPNGSDYEIARATLRQTALYAPREGDRVAAAKALIELSSTTVEGLVEMTIKAGIQPSQFIEFLTKKWEEGN
jgi:hypothetical protein